MQDKITEKLVNLKSAAEKYREKEPLSIWVFLALSRYISSGKASRIFEDAFTEYSEDNYLYLISRCLKGDKSDDGIIKTCKRIFHCQ